MEKVLLISGSPRVNGNTMQILHQCADILKAMSLGTEIISLSGKYIRSCLACRKCIGTGVCVLDDGVNEIADKIRLSRGLIVGAPVYFGTARGEIMSLLQRIGNLSYNSDRFLSWKVGGPLAIARRGGATATIQEMLMFFFINEMIVPGSTYWNLLFGKEPGEAMKDLEGVHTIERFAENIGKLIIKITDN